MTPLGQVASTRGARILASRGVLSDQYESFVTNGEATLSLLLDPSDLLTSRHGRPFRAAESSTFSPRGASFLMRVTRPMTVVCCVFGSTFLDELAETEPGLQLNRFEFISGFASKRLSELCRAMHQEVLVPGFASSIFADAAAAAAAIEIARHNGGRRPSEAPARGGLAPWQMQRLDAYAREHFGAELSVSELAKSVGLSVRHLSRCVRIAKGMSVHEWIAGIRLREARRLLAHSKLPVNEVAFRVGFRSPAAFSAAFRIACSYTPSEFRRLNFR